MSEKIKNVGESDDGVRMDTGWEEVEALSEHAPKHMKQGVPLKSGDGEHRPRHMRQEESEWKDEEEQIEGEEVESMEEDLSKEDRARLARSRLSEADQVRLENWEDELQKSREFIKKFNEQKRVERLHQEDTGEELVVDSEDKLRTEDDEKRMEETENSRSETERKPLRPEELGMKLDEGESAAKEVLDKQPGLTIAQDVENGDSEFWMNGADKGDGAYATTVNKELENYREQIENAKDMGGLSRALRIKESVRQALGDNTEVMEQFERVAEEAGYREKQQRFSGGAAEYERGRVSLAAEDMRKQVVGAEEELSEIENSLKQYRGLRGMFGRKRAEKAQLKWQRDNAKQRLERMKGDLAELERRLGVSQDD